MYLADPEQRGIEASSQENSVRKQFSRDSVQTTYIALFIREIRAIEGPQEPGAFGNSSGRGYPASSSTYKP